MRTRELRRQESRKTRIEKTKTEKDENREDENRKRRESRRGKSKNNRNDISAVYSPPPWNFSVLPAHSISSSVSAMEYQRFLPAIVRCAGPIMSRVTFILFVCSVACQSDNETNYSAPHTYMKLGARGHPGVPRAKQLVSCQPTESFHCGNAQSGQWIEWQLFMTNEMRDK